MKLRKIVIYGFGKHEDKTIEFTDGVNVLYGHNEAGKTTIQQFVLQVLFGFPKKQSVYVRYEPKSGGKYGGQVHLEDDTYGTCVVERVRGKATGEVTVYLPDGRQGGEELLQRIMRHYDRASFEAIFSFSVLQLQGFERMNESELSRTLLASGTTGVDSLVALEKKMDKEAGDLFKKAGRVPEMNVRLQQLKELEDELKLARERQSTYAPKVARIREIEQELQAVKDQYEGIRARNRTIDKQLQLLPLHERKRLLLAKRSALREGGFPSDGIRRYETINSRLLEAEAKRQGLDNETNVLKEQLEQNVQAEDVAALESLLAREPEWHEWRSSLVTIQDSERQLFAKKHQLLDRLGLQDAEEMLQADVSIHQEEHLYTELQQVAELDRQLEYIDRQLSQLEAELKELKLEWQHVQEKGPTEEELKKADEWPTIRSKLAQAKAFVQLNENRVRGEHPAVFIVLLLASVVAIGLGFIEQQWLILLAGLCIAGVAVLREVGKRKQSPAASQQEMQRLIDQYGGQEADAEQLLDDVRLYRDKTKQLTDAIQSKERKIGHLETDYAKSSQEKERKERALQQFFLNYGMTSIPNASIVHQFFSMARSLQEIHRELNDSKRRQQTLSEHVDLRASAIRAFVGADCLEDVLYEKLRTKYVALQSELKERAHVEARLTTIEQQQNEMDGLIASLRQQQEALFDEASVETEADYYEAYEAHAQRLQLSRQLADIDAQLDLQPVLEVDVSEEIVQDELVRNEKTLNILTARLDDLVQEKANLQAETDQLLTDDAYQVKQQQIEMKKTELEQLAMRWATRQAIVQAIRSMMTELKDRKLPHVLERAQQLFSTLTAGAYVALEITEDGLFRAVANNAVRYPIIELSQATKEQAYISLRLALAMEMKAQAPFPVLLDDPFVHFDGERLKRMLQLIDEISSKHQFIYMTCHDKIIEEWTNATIINVSTVGNDKGAVSI